MIKIWAKIIKGEKITNDILYESDKNYTSAAFDTILREICYRFDIPVPIVLKSHKTSFSAFNQTKFSKNEFVESVDFDTLVLEYVQDVKKKTKRYNDDGG